jgi:hypothetical protein
MGAEPSPSLATAARPGSAAVNAPSQAGGPPPSHSNRHGSVGYGGYPSHRQGHGLHGAQSVAGRYGMSVSGGQGHGNNLLIPRSASAAHESGLSSLSPFPNIPSIPSRHSMSSSSVAEYM